ncbi:MAG: NAD(P)H-dependent oxidoreductase subunit E [Clostridia bacterium]|nr:NAD(P)H-dependent oxidoreductase subunit E [Clostridia bacterium]MBN2883901.1 NAD(P)H-dependent oxidoreductase subunit E [Clostridia bacterium]
MCENKFAEEKFRELDGFIEKVGASEGNLIEILHKAQDLFGYLPKEVQLYVSRSLGISAAKVNGVVTFYSYFTEIPKGKHVISVCMGTACFVRGASDILVALEKKLGIKTGQTTKDGKFTIDSLRCVGACGLAPVVIADGKVHGRVEVDDLDNILVELESGVR